MRRILHLPSLRSRPHFSLEACFSSASMSKQSLISLRIRHPQTRGAGTLVPRHHPTPHRVNCGAEANHLEWVALLPSRATRDVVHLPLVIDIPKCAGGVLHSSEILEEPPQPGEGWQIVSYLHLSIVLLTRCFTSDDVKGSLPKGLVKRVFEINFEESPDSTLRDRSIIKELQDLGAD